MTFHTVLYNGISQGVILVLIASGLTLIFGLMGVVNFAHGELYAVGAYAGFAVQAQTGSFVLALLGAVVAGALIGALMEVTIIRPLYNRDVFYQIPVTFGAIIVITESIKLVWGSESQSFPIPGMLSGTIDIFGTSLGLYRTFILVAGIALVVLMWIFLTRTKYGLVIRAAIYDTETIESMGYNKKKIFTMLFAVGSVYAALAGALISPLFGVYPGMGTQVIIPAFIVVIVGGLGSFKGSVIAGLAIGISLSFGRIYIPELSQAIPFLLMAAVLLYRPRGLFGVEGVFH